MARNWKDVRAEALTSGRLDDARIAQHRGEFLTEVRARGLADIRERLRLSQTAVATQIGVSQSRISRLERGDLDRSEIGTIRAYVGALGGELEIIVRFGDEQIAIG